jgi:HD domain
MSTAPTGSERFALSNSAQIKPPTLILPSSGSVLGVDVGWSTSRWSSAVCRLDWDETGIGWSIARFRALEPERAHTIARIAGDARLLAAAFDGPLRRGLDVIGKYRAAELMLTRRLHHLIGKPGQANSPTGRLLNAHANHCAAIVLDHCDLAPSSHSEAIHETAIVEAFPSSFLGVLIAEPALKVRRGNRSDIFYEHLVEAGSIRGLLEHLLPGRIPLNQPSTITDHDERAAFVCALSALCVAAEDFAVVGDEDGWIVLPPPSMVQAWALDALRANAEEARKPLLRPESIIPTNQVMIVQKGREADAVAEDRMGRWVTVQKAAEMAALWHVHQKKKGAAQDPFINHLLAVASLVADATHGTDPDLVIAALLHDAIEHQGIARETIADEFGEDVAHLVEQCTDDKTLDLQERKRKQVEDAPKKSYRAKLIKLADKTDNVRRMGSDPPPDWTIQRRSDYIERAREVVAQLRGTNEWLARQFDLAADAAERSVDRTMKNSADEKSRP